MSQSTWRVTYLPERTTIDVCVLSDTALHEMLRACNPGRDHPTAEARTKDPERQRLRDAGKMIAGELWRRGFDFAANSGATVAAEMQAITSLYDWTSSDEQLASISVNQLRRWIAILSGADVHDTD